MKIYMSLVLMSVVPYDMSVVLMSVLSVSRRRHSYLLDFERDIGLQSRVQV